MKKIVLVGNNCGKTSMLIRYVYDKFPEKWVTGVNHYETDITIKDKNVKLLLIDTSNHENNSDRDRPFSYVEAHIVIVMFSIVDLDSYRKVSTKWKQELTTFCPNVPIILVGNKIDLRYDPEIIKQLEKIHQKPLQREEGLALCKKIGANIYLECSAKTNEGVNVVFETATKIALSKNSPSSQRTCKVQ